MADNQPKKSNRIRNIGLFIILIALLSCCGLYWLGNGESGNTTFSSNNRGSTSVTQPTSTSVRFDPIRIDGRGDDVVSINKPDVPAIVRLTHTGSSNFIVTSHDGAGNEIDLLVNEIGPYEGTRPLDFAAAELTERLEIQADGNWAVVVEPLSAARSIRVPAAKFSGQGDSVLVLSGSSPDTADISHLGESNFVVKSYGRTSHLLVNEIGDYEGTVIIPGDTAVLEVVADGQWQIAITGR